MKSILESKDGIIVLGFGGHARTLCDSIEKCGKYKIVGYTDIKDNNSTYRYLGDDTCLQELFESGIKYAAMGIGQIKSPELRIKLYNVAKGIGFEFPVIVDPSSIIGNEVIIGEGTFVGKGVIIETGAVIGKMCIINTKTIISHDGTVGDFSHITVANICGGATIGNKTFVGAGATVSSFVKVGNNVFIGAGALVLSEVADDTKVLNKNDMFISKRS